LGWGPAFPATQELNIEMNLMACLHLAELNQQRVASSIVLAYLAAVH
jgi:hypothetical protein